jgi:hypothetical protein
MLDLFWLAGPFVVGWLLFHDWYHYLMYPSYRRRR